MRNRPKAIVIRDDARFVTTPHSRQLSLLAALRAVGGFSTAILFIVGGSLAGCVNPGCTRKRSSPLMALYVPFQRTYSA